MSGRMVVKQGYELVNARYKLNTSEVKLIMNAISEIKMEDEAFKVYEISVSQISQELASELKYSRLKAFCEGLLKKPITISEEDGFLVVNWFSSIRYIRGAGLIQYKISDDLKPYLLKLKEQFVQYNLKYILPMQSSYSIRLYQLMKKHENMEKFQITVKELQTMLEVPSSLMIYANFKLKVLLVAQKELISYGDVFFEFEEVKRSRKVSEILFRVKRNDWNVVDKPTLF